MKIIYDKLNDLLKDILISSYTLKDQVKLLKNKNNLLMKIDEIIDLYENLKNEKQI